MFDRPKPRYVVTEFYLARYWTGDLPAAILSSAGVFSKDQAVAIYFFS